MAQQRGIEGQITGAWVRSLSDNASIEGFYLYPDGRLRFVNIFSMLGKSWSVKEDKLTMFSHTERYPQPEADIYRIRTISDKKMVLVRKGRETVYRRPAFNKSLLGTLWVASYIPGLPIETVPGQKASFSFQKGGVIEGFAGCNNFRGPYSVKDKKIWIGPLIATKMLCPAMTVEDNLYKALEANDEFLIVEDQLYLYKGNALRGFFKAQDEK